MEVNVGVFAFVGGREVSVHVSCWVKDLLAVWGGEGVDVHFVEVKVEVGWIGGDWGRGGCGGVGGGRGLVGYCPGRCGGVGGGRVGWRREVCFGHTGVFGVSEVGGRGDVRGDEFGDVWSS